MAMSVFHLFNPSKLIDLNRVARLPEAKTASYIAILLSSNLGTRAVSVLCVREVVVFRPMKTRLLAATSHGTQPRTCVRAHQT
jgi:hypothetical protein